MDRKEAPVTITLAYDRDAARKRAESASRPISHGRAFYGRRLHRVIEPRQSIVSGLTDWYMDRDWPAVVILFAVAALIAFGIVEAL